MEAIHKGEELAKKNMVDICRVGTTIPFGIKKTYCSTTVLLRPAREGAGITAGGTARPILALAGLSDCTAKFFGSNNRVNCARATFEALKSIESPAETLKHRRDRKYRIESHRAVRVPAEGEAAGAKAAPKAPPTEAAPQKAAPADAPAVIPVQADTRPSKETAKPAKPIEKQVPPPPAAAKSVEPADSTEPEGGAAEEPDSSAVGVGE